jgi:putative transcriptional regulator
MGAAAAPVVAGVAEYGAMGSNGFGKASSMESLEGNLLLASPRLLDSNFVRAVVLLIQHSDEGALGVVINRPTSKKVKELWKQIGDADCQSEQPVYLGGPVSGPLMAVHTSASLAEVEIVPGVYFAARKPNLDELVLQEDQVYKLFIGHAGWGPGQLERELKEGAWLTVEASLEYVFYDGENLWEDVAKQIGRCTLQSILKIKHVPADPSMN